MDGIVEEVREDNNKSGDSDNSNKESIIFYSKFTMLELSTYNDNSILIDTGSTFSVIKKPKW